MTVKEFTVTPAPKLTAVAPVRYVPVMITAAIVCPWMPELGDAEVTVGGAAFTVNPDDFVPVPPGVVTETVRVPVAAPDAMVILAVIWVELLTVNEFTVISEPKLMGVAPVRYVPVMITADKVCPWMPEFGDAEVTVGGAAFTVKPAALVPVPLGVVTETVRAPVEAPEVMVILAVIWVALLTVKEFTVTPAPKLTAVAPVRYVPVMITAAIVSP